MDRHVLMVCYYYPPLADVGTLRSISFAKYFRKHGWHPFIVTVANPDRAYCTKGNSDPPEGIPVVRTHSLINLYELFGKINGAFAKILNIFGINVKRNYLYDFLCIPDILCGWIPLTILKCLSIIRDHEIDTIYVSCPPFSAAVIGYMLKILTKKFFVVDFRDPYALDDSDISWIHERPILRRYLDRSIEKSIIGSADCFVVTTVDALNRYKKRYPRFQDKMAVVHNGFFAEYLSSLDVKEKYKKFTLIHTGELYFFSGDATLVFQVIAELKNHKIISSDNFQFLLYGKSSESLSSILRRMNIQDIVRVEPWVEKKILSDVIARSHLQFMRVLPASLPTKLIEGIASGVPVIAVVQTEEAECLIQQYSPGSYVIRNNSFEDLYGALSESVVASVVNEIDYTKLQDFRSKFERGKLALEMMRLIAEKCCDS